MYPAQQLQPVRQSYWENKPTWTVYELVFLIHGYEPIQMDDLKGIDETGIKARLPDWAEWCTGCPGILPTDRHPMETPVDKIELICWASKLSGVDVPDWMLKIVKDSKQPAKKKRLVHIGDRAQENIFVTLGALALLAAKNTTLQHGTIDDPNVDGIAASCMEIIGEVYGQKKSSLRERITMGLQLLADKR